MILMILYTKVKTGSELKQQKAEVSVEIESPERPMSLLTSDKLAGFVDLSDGSGTTDNEGTDSQNGSESEPGESGEEEDDILGPAEKMDLEKARKQPYGLVVELDYVSADRISLHGGFGYMAIALHAAEDGSATATIENAVTLEELGGIKMGGAAYTDVLGGEGCALIVPGIHNEEIARRRKFLYIEETNEITGGIVAPEWMMKKSANHDYSDAVVEETLVEELKQILKQQLEQQTDQVGGESVAHKLLYGPVVVPEYDSNIYGFLAENGENLEDIWYGQWNRDIGTIVRIPLFAEE